MADETTRPRGRSASPQTSDSVEHAGRTLIRKSFQHVPPSSQAGAPAATVDSPDSPYDVVALALAKAIREEIKSEGSLKKSLNDAKSRFGQDRKTAAAAPDAIRALQRDIQDLKAALNSDKLKTGPGTPWLKAKNKLLHSLAHCEHNLSKAKNQLEKELASFDGLLHTTKIQLQKQRTTIDERHRQKKKLLESQREADLAKLDQSQHAAKQKLADDLVSAKNSFDTNTATLARTKELRDLSEKIEHVRARIANPTLEIGGKTLLVSEHIAALRQEQRRCSDWNNLRPQYLRVTYKFLSFFAPQFRARRIEKTIAATERRHVRQMKKLQRSLEALETSYRDKQLHAEQAIASLDRAYNAKVSAASSEIARLEQRYTADLDRITEDHDKALASLRLAYLQECHANDEVIEQALQNLSGEHTSRAKPLYDKIRAGEAEQRSIQQQLAVHDELAVEIERERERLGKSIHAREDQLRTAEAEHSRHVSLLLAELNRDHERQLAQLNGQLEKHLALANDRLMAAVRETTKAVGPFQVHQPPLASLRPASIQFAEHNPMHLCLGWVLAEGTRNWECWFPSTVPFPVPCAISLASEGKESRHQVQDLLLRLMTALPPNGLTVNVIDPLKLGESLGPLRKLLNRPGPFFARQVTTLADEIEAALQAENDYLEQLVQTTLGDGPDPWQVYNKKNPRTPLQYRVIVYYDVPEQLTEKSVVFLQRLIELGPARGILPIIVLRDSAANDRRGAALHTTVTEKAVPLADLCRIGTARLEQIFAGVARCEAIPDESPPRTVCEAVLDEISSAYAEAINRAPGIDELWGDGDFWRFSATDGLSIPLGWSRDGSPVNLELGRPGGIGIHTLVAGRPGSGKSSLLHVLLHSLCHRYSPAEVRVMLLDYKQGVEMAMYASPVLPHADLIAMDSDVSYGVTVLEYLTEEIERRAKLFQEAKKTSLDQYNRKCDASARLPRILLLIDEFQVLFAEDRATTTDVESLLISLLRQGRAYGIHVLLCTQTLSGLTNISLTQLTALIAERICLACDAQDSAKTLSSGNEAGSRLSGPPEAILNSSNGSKDANRLFVFPEPIVAACQQHLLSLSQNAANAGFASSARLFRGDEAVTLPPTEFFDANARRSTDPYAVVGQTLSFDAGPLVIPWPARLGGHVLVTGPSPAIRDGVVAALVRSLASLDKPLAVTLYDVRANPLWQSIKANSPEVVRFSQLPEDWDGDFAKIPVLKPGDLGVFIIDGLDQDRLLKNAAIRPRTTTPPITPTMAVIEFLESAHKKGWRVIATADNWRRLDTPDRKDLLNEFQIRIGFQMSDDDAARMTFNAARSFGISGNQDRAIYFDQHANRLERFRPFVSKP